MKLTSSPRLIVPAPQFAHSLHGLGLGNIAPIWQGHSGNKPNSGEQCITLQKLGKSCHTAYVIYILYHLVLYTCVRLGSVEGWEGPLAVKGMSFTGPAVLSLVSTLKLTRAESCRIQSFWGSKEEMVAGPIFHAPSCSKILGQSHVISRDSRVDLPQLSFSMESRGISRLARRSIHAVR